MPYASIKFTPGADVNETPALNESGISQTQLVRWIYDRKQGALIQKLGGWTRFSANPTTAVVRALAAWQDTQGKKHLAYGTETSGGSAQLGVITAGTGADVTPRFAVSDITAAVTSVVGNSLVTITDATTTGVTRYDTVYIATHIAVGGLVLFGQYTTDPDGFIGSTSYTVRVTDILGTPKAATSSSSAPVLPLFTTVASNPSVTVTLPKHGYTTSSEFPVLLATTVGGAIFLGHYPVATVVDADNFMIIAGTIPNASTTGQLNGNLAHYVYGFGVGAVPGGTGYGVGAYGSGGYGVGTAIVPAIGTPIDAADWTLDNWGKILIACPVRTTAGPRYQPIYQWDPESGSPTATVIPQAPTVNDGVFVAMPQRQLVAWGSTFDGLQDPLLLRWCDISNYSVWVGTTTNQAGSYRLSKGSRIIGCLQTPQQGLIWTDSTVWSMQYTGPPYIYSFNEIGTACGLIGRKAMGALNGAVFWMGASRFFTLGADGAKVLPCPVWDVVFQNLDQTQLGKIRCAVNAQFSEITWYYPTTGSSEVNAYVKFNTILNAWDFGTMGRSAWVGQSVLGAPIGADPVSRYLYQHETSTDADGQPMQSSFQSGYAALSDGDHKMYIDQVWPDMKFGYYGGTQGATVNLTFYVADYPGQTPKTYGPYTLTSATTFISPRFRGRLVSVGLSSSDTGSFWRIGNIRYRVKPDGVF